MKVVRFHAPGDVRVEDAPEPNPGAGDVKIRVRNCSTCGTDVKIFRFGHHHIHPPRVMGHEVAGEVVEVGAGVTGWEAGDRVQVIAAIPDGTCGECRRGRLTVCPNQESIGYHFEGGFAEYMIVPAKVLAVDGLNRIPDSVSFAEASVAEPFACAINGQNLARVGEGDDVIITAAASGRAQEQAIQMAARQARISFFGGLPKDNPIISVDSNLVHYRELTIVGANGSSPAHNKEALGLIASGAVPVDDLITHRLPLDRTLDAFDIVAKGQGIKVTIEP
jgi:L-iditol 2-dehydrogenase